MLPERSADAASFAARPRSTARPRSPRSHLVLALLTAGALLAGAPASARAESEEFRQPFPEVGSELVSQALGLLGVRYKWGGNSPETGLDCSGLVRHVFEEAAGVVLPRRAIEMSRAGQPVHRHELSPGDLVFFNTLRRAFSHVGIYIGDGHFVHAPSSGGKVRVERLEASYWASRFNGARRLLATDTVSFRSSD